MNRRSAALAAATVVTLVVLLGSGGGALSPPPLGSPSRWSTWLGQREPVAAAFALLRLAALAGLWYLAGVTFLGVVLRAIRAVRLVAVADRFTVAPVRRLLAGTVTAGLIGLGPVGAAAAQPAPSPASTSTTLVTASTSSTVVRAATTTTVVATGDTVVLRRLPAADPAPTTGPARLEGPATTAAPANPVDRPPATWKVEPGDCFWTIAEELLRQAWHRAPTDAEIVPYWQAVIEANREALADPGNADLIFPGQEFKVPSPPPQSPSAPAALARTG